MQQDMRGGVTAANWHKRLLRLRETPAVTLVGASERSAATRMVLDSLSDERCRYAGRINIVNPRSPQVFGRETVASLADVEGEPGLVWLFVRGDEVLPTLNSARIPPRGVIVYAAGYREAGHDDREAELAAWAEAAGVPVFGPQSVGLAFFSSQLSVLDIVTNHPVRCGHVGLIAQSGGVTSAAVSAFLGAGIGLSSAFALGNSAVMDVEVVASHLLRDEATRAIAIYAESLGSAAALARLGHAAQTAGKPVVLLRGGVTEAGHKAAASHTGALATPGKLIEGIAAQFGIVLVDNLDQMVSSLLALEICGDAATGSGRIGVISNYGGANVLFADAAARSCLNLPPVSAQTRRTISPDEPGAVANPYDASGGMLGNREEFARRLELFAADPAFDLIVYLFAQLPDPAHTAHFQRLEEFARVLGSTGKPGMVATLYRDDSALPQLPPGAMVGRGLEDAMARLKAVATFAAARTTAGPAPEEGDEMPDGPVRVLTGIEIREMLGHLDVGWPDERTVEPDADLAAALEGMAYPLVAKAEAGLPHRASAGAVLLGLPDLVAAGLARDLMARRFGAAVTFSVFVPHEHAWFIGLSRTSTGSPVVAVGPGGALSERDIHFRVLPLSDSGAMQFLQMAGVGEEHRSALARVVAEAAKTMADPALVALDINPIVADAEGRLVVLDAKGHRGQPQGKAPEPTHES